MDNNTPMKKVLVVDESVFVTEQIYQLLQSQFDVFTAALEQSVQGIIGGFEPDIVLIGIHGASVNAFSLCQKLDVPVVLLTEVLSADDMVKAFEVGAIDLLALPDNPNDGEAFRQRISGHIRLTQSRRLRQVALHTDNLLSDDLVLGSPTDNEKPKILIVDDSVSNIQLLNDMLGDEHQIFFATNGKQAIDIAIEQRPDLIVLDVVMPQMDGYQVCSQLKAMSETKDIGIIFVTALNEASDETKGLEMGAIDYITKPFNGNIVKARMRNHMELITHRKMLDSLSMTDGMTGIPNRRQFDVSMERELHRAIRQQEPLAVILVDIDHFKKYNDHYGHVSGDECLKKVANALVSCRVRKTDAVTRYGGEEFAVVLPNTDREGGLTFAHKMLAAVCGLQLEHVHNADFGHVTASFGLYAKVPEYGETIASIVQQADDCLYQAKSQGRNRVV